MTPKKSRHSPSSLMDEVKLRVLSLGAGVQSTTMALMAAHGEIGPMPDCAIFADTGAEPSKVYRHLDWLETQLPYPVYRVSAGNIYDDLMAGVNTTGQQFASIPFFTLLGDKKGMGRRQCTKEYKIVPIRREVSRLLGENKKTPGCVEMWIGISTDEALRMKPSNVKYITHRWPLIEEGISRRKCFEWARHHSMPTPPKSACTFCPYRDNRGWREMKDNDPSAFAQAVEVDDAIRKKNASRMNAKLFLHRSLTPLKDVDLSTDEERGQPDLFNNDCEGMCGV